MKKAYLCAGISILFWSSLATVSKLLLGSLNSYQVLMFSALFAAAVLLLSTVINGKIKVLKNYRIKDYIIMLLIGLPGTFFYYIFLYEGTARMAASQAFIINYLWPIMSVLFACILLKEKLTLRKGIALALSFLGVLTVAGNDLLSFNPDALFGMVLCVLAAVSYGVFTALGRRWNYDEQITVMVSFLTTAVLTAVINLCIRNELKLGAFEIFGFVWNGVFVMAIATVTWALALKFGGTAKISNLAYITPFLSLLWTFLILKEPIKPLSVLGLAIIVLGIFVQMKAHRKTL